MRNTLVPHILKCLSYLPLSVARGFGVFVGTCMWLSKGRGYRITLKNVRLCFPQLSPHEVQTFTRKSLIETAKTATEA
ncbi:MAG: lipid A biosynthesis lauroyl acyltransferase, partial [Moraxellaceae bacterium]